MYLISLLLYFFLYLRLIQKYPEVKAFRQLGPEIFLRQVKHQASLIVKD